MKRDDAWKIREIGARHGFDVIEVSETLNLSSDGTCTSEIAAMCSDDSVSIFDGDMLLHLRWSDVVDAEFADCREKMRRGKER